MALTTPAHAGLLVGTTLPTSAGAELAVINAQFLEQAFTLTTSVQVTGIGVQMSGFGSDVFTLWLTNAIGPGTTVANVLLQTTLVFPNTGGGTTGATVNVLPNLFLSPGSYFLIESSAQTSVLQGWIGFPATPIPTSFGSVGSTNATCCISGIINVAFPPGSTFSTPISSPLAFQISGNAIPEPQNLFALLTGLVALLVLKARKSRRT